MTLPSVDDPVDRAAVLHRAGRLDEAEAAYRLVLERDGANGAAALNLSALLLSRDRVSEAERLVDGAIAAAPRDFRLRLALGGVLAHLGQADASLRQLRCAVALAPGELAALLALGRASFGRDALDDGIRLLRRAVRIDPARAGERRQLAELLFRRGRALRRDGAWAGAEAGFREALRANAGHAAAAVNLSSILRRDGRSAQARDLLQATAGRVPDDGGLRIALGRVLVDLGADAAATEQFRQALAALPTDMTALLDLGHCLHRLGRPLAVATVFRRVLRLDAGQIEARLRLVGVLAQSGRPVEARRALAVLDPAEQAGSATYHGAVGTILSTESRNAEAATAFRRAIALEPDRAAFHVVLGRSLQLVGRLAAAVAATRRAVRLDPRNLVATSNLIVMRDFDPTASMIDITAERLAWQDRHGAGIPAPAPHLNVPEPERRLRIGYVSSYFRKSSGAMIYGPIIEAQSTKAFEVFCYSSCETPDAVTARIRAVSRWVEVGGLSDAEVAARIRQDRIDILVDVDGHSAGNRLSVFAHKPAPVQVTGWGHAGGTGLAAMDYAFVDPIFARRDEQARFVERLVDLPCVITVEPPDAAPPITPAPVRRNGFVTFGCFNRVAKITPLVLGAWARILDRVPDSRLLLKGRMLDDAAMRARVLGELAGHGIAAERVELLGGSSHDEHLAAHGRADIALDPFPMTGGVTTVEALWMGVPVVTFLGDTMFGRVGASVLGSLDEPRLIGAGVDDYVDRAVDLAGDLPALDRYRATLRDRLSASPVGNPRLYTRYVEEAYRRIWRDWCRRRSSS